MDIVLKYKIVEKVIQSKNETLLNEVKALIGLSDSDFWNVVPSEVKQAISEAKTELDGDMGIPHEEVMDGVEERFLR